MAAGALALAAFLLVAEFEAISIGSRFDGLPPFRLYLRDWPVDGTTEFELVFGLEDKKMPIPR